MRLLEDAASVKPGTAMVRLTVAVSFSFPDVPVTVTVDVPPVAVLAAVSVRALELVALAGLKDAVTPLGRPDATRLTAPLKLF